MEARTDDIVTYQVLCSRHGGVGPYLRREDAEAVLSMLDAIDPGGCDRVVCELRLEALDGFLRTALIGVLVHPTPN